MEAAEPAYDAAFGPMGAVTAPTPTADFVAKVREVQNLLNARGFGPVAVTGTVNGETGEAYVRFRRSQDPAWQVTPFNVNEALERLRDIRIQGGAPAIGVAQGALTQAQPIWKNPKVLWAAAGVAAIVGYVAYRSGSLRSLGLGDGKTEDEPKPKKAKRASEELAELSSTKCSRLPQVDFSEALPLEDEPS